MALILLSLTKYYISNNRHTLFLESLTISNTFLLPAILKFGSKRDRSVSFCSSKNLRNIIYGHNITGFYIDKRYEVKAWNNKRMKNIMEY